MATGLGEYSDDELIIELALRGYEMESVVAQQ